MASYQVHVVEDLGGAVHLAQDDDHLVVDELFELPQVAHHLHLQLCADLPGGGGATSCVKRPSRDAFTTIPRWHGHRGMDSGGQHNGPTPEINRSLQGQSGAP